LQNSGVYNSRKNIYYISSPYNDTVTYHCPKFTGKFQIEKGLTKINISDRDLLFTEFTIKQRSIATVTKLLENDADVFRTLMSLNEVFEDMKPVQLSSNPYNERLSAA
jgi:hypothetical protein